MIGTQSMAGQVMKTPGLGKPSKHEKKGKKLLPAWALSAPPPSTRLPREARPPASVRRSPHCRATGVHLDTEIVVKAVTSVPVKKTESDASRVMFVSEIKPRLLVPRMSVEWQLSRPEAPIFGRPLREQKGEKKRKKKRFRNDLKRSGERTLVALLSHRLSTEVSGPVCIADWFR